MEGHQPVPSAEPRLRPWALRWTAVALTLAGAVMLFSGVVSAGIALPLVAIGVALVAIEQTYKRRERQN